ncbi:MAG: MarR family transcriptional regulator [Ancalomicrobiaceae bacterium]|nr:MarR family transcriptional regulator [Ancalomicrobiaceae bacterium]
MILLADVSRLARTYVDTRARRLGTTRTQWALLKRLSKQPGLTQAELAEYLEIQPISLARLVDRLVAQGLVKRAPHPTDRRANCVFITGAGEVAMHAFEPLAQEITDDLFAGIDPAEVDTALRVMVHCKANIKEKTAEHRQLCGEVEAVADVR